MRFNAKIVDKNGNTIKRNVLDMMLCGILGETFDIERYAPFHKRNEFSDDLKGEIDYLSKLSWYDITYNFIECGKDFQDILDIYRNEVFKDYPQYELSVLIPYQYEFYMKCIELGYKGVIKN